MTNSESKELVYTYKFKFKNNTEKVFKVFIDPDTMETIRDESKENPEWAKLKNFHCDNCAVKSNSEAFCPVALSLSDIIEFFSNIPSYEEAELEVTTPERTYSKTTSVQVGVGGLIGILMPTSGCPTMGKLKTISKIPFTPLLQFRKLNSEYFPCTSLAQYFRMKHGKKTDWDMNYLKTMYEEIQRLNVNIAKKIANLEKMDASINAVVVLNNFADSITFSLDDDDLSQIEFLFKDYF